MIVTEHEPMRDKAAVSVVELRLTSPDASSGAGACACAVNLRAPTSQRLGFLPCLRLADPADLAADFFAVAFKA